VKRIDNFTKAVKNTVSSGGPYFPEDCDEHTITSEDFLQLRPENDFELALFENQDELEIFLRDHIIVQAGKLVGGH